MSGCRDGESGIVDLDGSVEISLKVRFEGWRDGIGDLRLFAPRLIEYDVQELSRRRFETRELKMRN